VARAEENVAPAEAVFEMQRDRSTALLIKPGVRLKLDIAALTHDGLEKKKKAERERVKLARMSAAAKERAEQKALKKKKRQAYSWGGYDASRWDKDWAPKPLRVNEYTITLDIKLKNEPPREGLALFQTSLVFLEENPSSGRKTVKQSDGEAVIGSNGGVGTFGTLGDTSKVKVDVGRWRRVCVSVKNVSEGKGELRTWIDGVPCAVIRRDAISTDSRFSLDGESLYLFSSQKASMMPGDVLVRTVRVTFGESNDESVKLQHAANKIISMHEEEREATAKEQARGLSLAKLFAKPRPVWTASTLFGAVGDAFIERTIYEGSSILAWSYKLIHFCLRRAVEEQTAFLGGIDHAGMQTISDVLHILHQSAPMMQHMLRLIMNANDAQVMSYLGKLRKFLSALGVGDMLLLPALVEEAEIIILAERTNEQLFRFVVVQTDAELGLGHHPVNPALDPKLKYRTCLVLNDVPKKNALDNVFWMAVYAMATRSGQGDMFKFYDVLLPFLTGKPLETSLWETEKAAADGADHAAYGEWASPQRSDTSYVRCLFHAIRHMLKAKGMHPLEAKQVLLALRAQFVAMIANDLEFVHADNNAQRVCKVAVQQLNYSAVKLTERLRGAFGAEDPRVLQFQTAALAASLKLSEVVSDKLAYCEDVEVELPPPLDLRVNAPAAAPAAANAPAAAEATLEVDEPIPEDTTGPKLELSVKLGQRSVKVFAHSTSLVRHLCDKVARATGVPPAEQRLIYLGRILSSTRTLADQGISESGLALQLSIIAVDVALGANGEPAGPAGPAAKLKAQREALRRAPDTAPPMDTQYMDALAWDCEQGVPNPGQDIALRKYVAVDFMQMPARVSTREEAVRAIRLCDRLCTLLDHQPHCVKNDRLLIAALIQHTFTQLVPIPKPRGVDRATARTASRAERRRVRKGKRTTAALVRQEPEGAPQPDFAAGLVNEQAFVSEPCLWDQSITYELQVELMLVLHRLTEHFGASVFSIQQDRCFDAAVIVTMGAITAIADAVMRRRASDLPSEVCSHLMGQTRDGRQLGLPGYGLSPSSFATQTETIEAHAPELCVARTRVLDYFQSPQQRRLDKIFNWERHYELTPDRALIKYLRNVGREIALSDGNPHLLLMDGSPVENSLLKRNYPELRCYRDICFWWKALLNPEIKAFPNWVDPKTGGAVGRYNRLAAQLHWGWEHNNNQSGYVVWVHFQGAQLRCRPEPDRDAKGETYTKERQPPTHRYPSTATPSFWVLDLPPIKTEDDVVYRPNLPDFADDPLPADKQRPSDDGADGKKRKGGAGAGGHHHHSHHAQGLGQHDSELLISYLTVPYLRLPLVLAFFASDDRLHKLQSHKLRAILDSVLFEPGRYLALDLVGVSPVMIPTTQTQLLATSFGLLVNELVRSPDTVLKAVDALLEGALALDTGSVCDLGASDFNTSVDIILYVARLACRVENYVSFLVAHAKRLDECLIVGRLRDVDLSVDCLAKLEVGRAALRSRLLTDFNGLFEDYLHRLDEETRKDELNEKLIDRNSRLASDLHAVMLLMHRNTRADEFTPETARSLLGSFVFLTTRHTWNKSMREEGRLLVNETELYEVLQVQRRRLIKFCRGLSQGPLDTCLQSSLQVATSTTGSLRAAGQIVEAHNRWARIAGDRCVGRFAVGSTRTVAEADQQQQQPAIAMLTRQRSNLFEVGEVADSGMLGVELDLQIGQMTLRSKHLSALPEDISGHPDVRDLFGTSTMQASLLERGQHRATYRLVGLHHDLEAWQTPHTEPPSLGDAWEREYDPAELYDSESWIPPLFEPVRSSFFDGPNPPPMQFMMLERPLPEHAEVALIVGVHQQLGGAFKLVYLFRRLRCVHVYQAVSHGRRFWWTLHLSTDVRYTLRELQPSFGTRMHPPPPWWKRGAGDVYPPTGGLVKVLYDDIESYLVSTTRNPHPEKSVVIKRDTSHPDNLSNGKEVYIPRRLLFGLVPQCILDEYRFWRDETAVAANGRIGHMRLLGYSIDAEGEFMVRIDMQAARGVEIVGHIPARTVRVVRRRADEVKRDFEQKRRLAQALEQMGLLVRPRKESSKARRKTRRSGGGAAAARDGGKAAAGDQDASDDNGDGGGDDDDDDGEVIVAVGAVVEYAIRKGTWVEASIIAMHDDETVDVELRGAVHGGLVLRFVHPRNMRRKPADEGPAKDDDDAAGGSKKGKVVKDVVDGEGVWRYEHMSSSDDEDWATHSEDEDRDKAVDDADDGGNNKKDALSFAQIDSLPLLVEAAGGDEERALALLRAMRPAEPFTDVMKLARAVAKAHSGEEDAKLVSHLVVAKPGDQVLLNLLYAPKGSRLFSLARTLARIENLSNVCAWTKVTSHAVLHSHDPVVGCGSIDLVELPRLKLSFSARPDHEGVVRLYSSDHADLFVTNERSPMTSKMLDGIPHSLLLCNTQGETHVLVPVVCLRRPVVHSAPFSTQLVLDRKDQAWIAATAQRYFLYPVHVSLSFLMSKGIDSALYLLLLRLYNRDYAAVFRLADSIATDTAFSLAGRTIFSAIAGANDDWHPDAHACRLKIAIVTVDSGVELPFDVTLQAARYAVKLSHVSAACRLSLEEELQLLDTEGLIAYETQSKGYNKHVHTPYVRSLVKNRQQALTGLLGKKDAVACFAPPRVPLSNWPYYVDNTVFGETYSTVIEVKSIDDWEALLAGEADDDDVAAAL